jgi:hypothetical protein
MKQSTSAPTLSTKPKSRNTRRGGNRPLTLTEANGILCTSAESFLAGGVYGSEVRHLQKKADNSVVWVEAVEDIVTAKKRLISLASDGTGDYRIWDSANQLFIDVMDDCA